MIFCAFCQIKQKPPYSKKICTAVMFKDI